MLWRPIRPPSQGSAWGVRYGTFDIEIESRTEPKREVLIVKDLTKGDVAEFEFEGNTLFEAASATWYRPSTECIDLCRALEIAVEDRSEAIPA